MKPKSPAKPDEMRREYTFDYSTAGRGKYLRRIMRECANVAVLEPDVAEVFRNSEAVNEALRSILQVSETTRRLTKSTSGQIATTRR